MNKKQMLMLIELLSAEGDEQGLAKKEIVPDYIKEEKWVIVRTYSAGCWFGKIKERVGNKIKMSNARRMWKWKAKQSISLSGCARYGIVADESRIAGEVIVWLEDIEIIECTSQAIQTFLNTPETMAN